jgi:hypothetical protein
MATTAPSATSLLATLATSSTGHVSTPDRYHRKEAPTTLGTLGPRKFGSMEMAVLGGGGKGVPF